MSFPLFIFTLLGFVLSVFIAFLIYSIFYPEAISNPLIIWDRFNSHRVVLKQKHEDYLILKQKKLLEQQERIKRNQEEKDRISSPVQTIHNPAQITADVLVQANTRTTACPYCGEEILSVAKKCKHCGEFLDDSRQKRSKAVFKASSDFIGLMCSYHIMDANKNILMRLGPNQTFEVEISKDTTMYVWLSDAIFSNSVEVKCHVNEVNRFTICLTQMGFGCVVSRVDSIV